jgi:hypothetical protein
MSIAAVSIHRSINNSAAIKIMPSLELKAFLSFYSLRPASPRSDSNGGVVSRENANLRLLIIFWAVLPKK